MGSSQDNDVAMCISGMLCAMYCLAIFVPGGDLIVCVLASRSLDLGHN